MICNYDLPNGNIEDFEIPRLHFRTKTEIDAQFPHFFWNYLVRNRPCIVVADQVQQWPAMRDWLTSGGHINYDFLRRTYGDVHVPVTEIPETMNVTTDNGEMSCSMMPFKDYVQYWINSKENDGPCLYLKDWHILRNCGEASEKPYEPIQLFASDWLNEVSTKDDFRFAYMGPKGSRTPFHADVYGSFSWSINIIGRKKWRLYQPGKETQFKNSSTNHIVYTPEAPGIEGKDFIEVIQEAGETIFVPSGYYHVVWNETDVISINHNWFNASNICFIWHQLQNALDLVKREIEDLKHCEDFPEQCQLILRANHGMDYNDFCVIVMKIWNIRMAEQKNSKNSKSEGKAGDGSKVKDCTFDLCALDLSVVKHLIQDHLLEDDQVDAAWKTRLQVAVI